MANILIERESAKEVLYVSYFEGKPIHFIKNKATGQIFIDADDVTRALGEADSFIDYLSTDKGLDFVGEWMREHPNEPFIGGAVIERKGDNIIN